MSADWFGSLRFEETGHHRGELSGRPFSALCNAITRTAGRDTRHDLIESHLPCAPHTARWAGRTLPRYDPRPRTRITLFRPICTALPGASLRKALVHAHKPTPRYVRKQASTSGLNYGTLRAIDRRYGSGSGRGGPMISTSHAHAPSQSALTILAHPFFLPSAPNRVPKDQATHGTAHVQLRGWGKRTFRTPRRAGSHRRARVK